MCHKCKLAESDGGVNEAMNLTEFQPRILRPITLPMPSIPGILTRTIPRCCGCAITAYTERVTE